jgi:hypothetical protein
MYTPKYSVTFHNANQGSDVTWNASDELALIQTIISELSRHDDKDIYAFHANGFIVKYLS